MTYHTTLIFSLSILIASLIGWVRFRKIDPAYYPFLYCLWIGSLNEIINYILAANHQTNALNNNIYALLESLLLLWLFKNWGNFTVEINTLIAACYHKHIGFFKRHPDLLGPLGAKIIELPKDMALRGNGFEPFLFNSSTAEESL